MLRSLPVSLLVALTGAAQAVAQGASGQVEVSGGGAIHRLWDDESSIGTGVAASGAVSFPLTDTLKLRGRVAGFWNERDFGNGVIFEGEGVRYTADLLWQPFSSRHAPYFGAGIGGFSYTRTSHHPISPFQPGLPVGARSTFIRSGTDLISGGLGGFTAIATERFRLHPEASLWWSRPGYFIVIEIGVLASYRF